MMLLRVKSRLDSAVTEKIMLNFYEKPNSARMAAGFCWPWNNATDDNGELVKDVKIGDFAMLWETHDKIT